MFKRPAGLRLFSIILVGLVQVGNQGGVQARARILAETQVAGLENVSASPEDKALDLILYDAGFSAPPDQAAAERTARRIDRWIATHIRQEAGAAGRQSPQETILRRRGDSLDRAKLTTALMQRLGMPSPPISSTPGGSGLIGISRTPPDALDEALREVGLVPGQQITRDSLAKLNHWANQAIRYRSDRKSWKMADFFQTPLETLVLRSGDCEDYAILKAALLQRLGVPATALAFQPVRTAGVLGLGSASHMVLTVRLPQDATAHVLDSLYDAPYPQGQKHRTLTAHGIPVTLMNDILSGRTVGPRMLPQSPYAARRNLRL